MKNLSKLVAILQHEKDVLEDRGLTKNQVFGILFNKEFKTKSGEIVSMKSLNSTELRNAVFPAEPESLDFDL